MCGATVSLAGPAIPSCRVAVVACVARSGGMSGSTTRLYGITQCIVWVPVLGLALRVRPGMALSSGPDCSALGISPCPLRGSQPT
eukprot:4418505-Prymnesium_polylepis.1